MLVVSALVDKFSFYGVANDLASEMPCA